MKFTRLAVSGVAAAVIALAPAGAALGQPSDAGGHAGHHAAKVLKAHGGKLSADQKAAIVSFRNAVKAANVAHRDALRAVKVAYTSAMAEARTTLRAALAAATTREEQDAAVQAYRAARAVAHTAANQGVRAANKVHRDAIKVARAALHLALHPDPGA